jgi:hypothetical protein
MRVHSSELRACRIIRAFISRWSRKTRTASKHLFQRPISRKEERMFGEKKINAIMGGVYYLSKLTNSHVHVHRTIELLRYKLGAFWASQSGMYAEDGLLGCEAVYGGKEVLKVRKNLLSPYLGYMGAAVFFFEELTPIHETTRCHVSHSS